MFFIRVFKYLAVVFLMTVVSATILLCIAVASLIVTPKGAHWLIDYTIRKYSPIVDIKVGSYEGSIYKGLVLKDISVTRLPFWPAGQVRVQQMRVEIPLWHWDKISTQVLNARLTLPECEPIIFSGQIHDGVVEGDLYGRTIDVAVISAPFAPVDMLKDLQGFVSDVDFVIKGPVSAPQVIGRLFVDHIRYKTTTLSNGFGRLDVTLNHIFPHLSVQGEVVVDSGFVVARKVGVDLNQSKIYFKGDTYNPLLDIHGSSKVGDYMIDISIKGTYLKPELAIHSDPPLPQDVALLVLATGKRWTSTGTSLSRDTLSTELAGDFMDYFLLGGSGNEFAHQYGLSSAALPYDDQDRKVGLRKRLTDDINVGVELEQTSTLNGDPVTYSKKVEGALLMTDHVSFNISKKVLPQANESNGTSSTRDTATQQGETQVYLKYKDQF